MERKEVTIGKPVVIAGTTLIPVVEVSLNYWRRERGSTYLGAKQPVAVIVVSPSTKRAFRITGEEVPIDELAHAFPAIKSIKEIYPQTAPE